MAKHDMDTVSMVAVILLVVGALNWGLIGLGMGNVLESIVGAQVAGYLYILVGVAGLWKIWMMSQM